MEEQKQSAIQQNNEEQLSQNTQTTVQQADTIETCTMDPCTMKMESKTDHHGKCPECGKTAQAVNSGKKC